MAVHVLRNRNLDPHVIARAVDASVQSDPDVSTLPRTPHAKKVIEYAMEEARTLNHAHVGTEHILIALLREEEGIAAQVLATFGLEAEEVREEIKRVLNRPYDWGRRQYRPLSPVRLAVRRRSSVVAPPAVCPKCGQARVVRVLWRSDLRRGQDEEDLLAGKAILVPRIVDDGPPWVCLQCAPGWSEVHRLAMEDSEWQRVKEQAIGSQDFEKATRCRDTQDELCRKLFSLLAELLKSKD